MSNAQKMDAFKDRLKVIKGTIDLVVKASDDDSVAGTLDLASNELKRVIDYISHEMLKMNLEECENE